jgi:hypothetical protein
MTSHILFINKNVAKAKVNRYHHHVHKGSDVFLFLNPQNEVGPSISSLVVPRSFFLPVCISVPVLASYLCPSSVRVVVTFSGIVLFPYTGQYVTSVKVH